MKLPFYVYYAHCREISGMAGPLADEADVDAFVSKILACCCNHRQNGSGASVRVFKGIELGLEPIEIERRYRLKEKGADV